MAIWTELSIISMGIIAIDLVWHPQMMKIMNSVWMINALWGGPLILFAYFVYGRQGKKRKHWQSLTLNTLHCGAGCTLSDLATLILSFFIPLHFVESFIIAYLFALVIGVLFQYIALKEMHQHTKRLILLKKAITSDFLSLTAWQIGMLIGQIGMQSLHLGTLEFLKIFEMQVAMIIGFLISYPMNAWLVKKNIKSLMM